MGKFESTEVAVRNSGGFCFGVQRAFRLVMDQANRCQPSYFIDHETELNPNWLKDKKRIAIVAGASTLEETVAKVVSKIDDLTD